MCAYSQSDHALPHWKCLLRCCVQCPSIIIPDQETDDKHPSSSPSICFHIYHLIAGFTKHGRIPLTYKKRCRKCQQNTDSGQSKYIYTRKELVMMDMTISNFHTIFLFHEYRSWSFTLRTYKYWVRITVVTLVKMRLNAANHFKMCYVTVIMIIG